MALEMLKTLTRVIDGPREMDLSLHFVGRKQSLKFKLADKDGKTLEGGWFYECEIKNACVFRDPRPDLKCGNLATHELALAIEGDISYPALTEIRMNYDFRHGVGDVISFRLNDGTLITPGLPNNPCSHERTSDVHVGEPPWHDKECLDCGTILPMTYEELGED